jgi:hypothetical protein
MARDDLTGAAVVREYLDVLAGGLAGARRGRAAIVAEVADGLAEAVESRQERGMDRASAARAAVAEFGDPRELARLFTAGRAGAAARRVGLALVLTGPLVGAVWLAALTSRTGLDWPEQVGDLATTRPLVVVALLVGVPAAVMAAGAGSLWSRAVLPPRPAVGLAALAACAAVAADGILLAGTLAAPDRSGPVIVAVAVSLVRLIGAAAAVRRCAALRAAC